MRVWFIFEASRKLGSSGVLIAGSGCLFFLLPRRPACDGRDSRALLGVLWGTLATEASREAALRCQI